MNEPVFHHLRYVLLNEQVRRYPFPHFFAKNVFPEDFYSRIRDFLPPPDAYQSGKNNYNGRKFADPTTSGLFDFLLTPEFSKTIISVFLPDFQKRFPSGQFTPKTDLRLVLDGKNYSIGPHTDAPWKVVSLLFYLPPDYTCQDLGTSIYVPRNPSFRCPGGPHHPFDGFKRVWTAPFIPNSCFGFFKTDQSFHGVEPIPSPVRRDVLLWNLYDLDCDKG